MDKTNILDSDNFKEKLTKTVNYYNDYKEYLSGTVSAFKDSLSSMQKNLEIMHCEINNFFSSNNCVLSGLMSNIGELENKIKNNESDLVVSSEIDNFFSSNDYVLSDLMANINKLEDKLKTNELDLIEQKDNEVNLISKINKLENQIKASELDLIEQKDNEVNLISKINKLENQIKASELDLIEQRDIEANLISNINKLEDKLRTNELDLISQKNTKVIADKINTIDYVALKLAGEIKVVLAKMQSSNYCITDEELCNLEAQYEYLLQIREEFEKSVNEDASADLVQQKFEQAQKNKPIYDEIAMQINNIVNKHRTNKYAVEIVSNISRMAQDIHDEVDYIATQNQNITYEEIQQNITDLAQKKEILEENKKFLNEMELEASLDQVVQEGFDLFEHIKVTSDKIDLEMDKLTNFAQAEIELNDLINSTNSSADDLILHIDRINAKDHKHKYESVGQIQEEFDLLIQQAELLNQQKDSLVNYAGSFSEDTAQKRQQSLQYAESFKEKFDVALKILQDELQKACYAKNVIDNFKEFILSLEQEIDLICIKIKSNHYASIHDGVNELINKQQDMQNRQIELNNIRENLIPTDLLKKKMETSRKFIDIQEKISHFLLDIKIFNA